VHNAAEMSHSENNKVTDSADIISPYFIITRVK